MREISVKDEQNELQGTLIYNLGNVKPPPWMSIFENIDGLEIPTHSLQNIKALFVVICEGQFVCFTFGRGSSLIRAFAYERNFGLKTAINLADPDAIKSIDKTYISYISVHSREQATRSIRMMDFQLDCENQLLKSITAKGIKGMLGIENLEVSGRDSISFSAEVEIPFFSKIAGKLLTAYKSDRYKDTAFAWVDDIQHERDETKIARLDQKMVDLIKSEAFDYVWLASPEIIDYEEVEGFRHKKFRTTNQQNGPDTRDDLDIRYWVKECGIDESLTAKALKSKKVYQYFKGGAHKAIPVYRCLNCEIDDDGNKYILNDGLWYQIDASFVEEIDRYFNGIPDATFSLPAHYGMKEPDYLRTVVNSLPEQYALMDRENITHGEGRSAIEFCDLYSVDQHMIHVKRYGGSNMLSHLFMQGKVSAELFLSDKDFRRKVNAKLPEAFKLRDPLETPTTNDYAICYAVMSKKSGPFHLPFFSKVVIRHAARNILKMGFKVCKLKIEKDPDDMDGANSLH